MRQRNLIRKKLIFEMSFSGTMAFVAISPKKWWHQQCSRNHLRIGCWIAFCWCTMENFLDRTNGMMKKMMDGKLESCWWRKRMIVGIERLRFSKWKKNKVFCQTRWGLSEGHESLTSRINFHWIFMRRWEVEKQLHYCEKLSSGGWGS